MKRRRIGRLVGFVAVLASLAFLFLELRDGVSELSWSSVDGELALRWLAAIALYAVGLAGVHVAWGVAVSRAAPGAGVLLPALVSARAQIAKYLPGNVAHIAGRQVLAVRHGWPQAAVMGATLVEVAGLALAGALVVGGGTIAGVRVEIDVSRWVWVVAAALAVVVVGGVIWMLRRSGGQLRGAAQESGRAAPMIVGAYAVFLVLAGIGQWLLLEGTAFGTVVVAATAAWLVGFLSPGVPAGIGVREAVLAGTLSMAPEGLAIGLLGFRAATVLSDLLMFVIGAVWTARLPASVASRSVVQPRQ